MANVFSGLDTTDVISALVGAAAIKVGPGFAKWAANKVASFFR
ncbi:capsid protein [Dyella psychrodurans]|uniref:Capsid protein n=1 Tax=Dyella psychrodurans TaxID=1927960 RepID=A0A370XET0_9GAMM|nr:capsid protein [Dyella psychrodurans]